ncbi:GIY-YIG nuclease family protein [Bacillus cytotoxicus]|uniref:NUMOD3 domain-containing DNA-binding protein n=1 Tax=Bacillus cereus group sp. BfR-BA-01492 TaxID=2920361 RepID=UPI001F57EE6F|nr:NUMOD3 domain-containing DNA-binding protein [Bacillus cereus group sp. BfR-BA-01492]EMA6345059.1 GIY-YIG nuclease family protein [Bacillus cytotoxicus]
MSKMGIYRILNLVNRKFYVGSSNNLLKRKREHFGALKKGEHTNSYLQRAYNKYGANNFIFEVVEYIIGSAKLLDKEQYYIDILKACDRSVGYNINENATGGGLFGENNPNFGKPMSEEQKEKIRLTLTGHSVSEETRKKISIAHKEKRLKEKHWNYGRPQSIEQRMNHSKKMKGRYVGSQNPFYGKKHDEQSKKKMSEKRKGVYIGANCSTSIPIVQLEKDGTYVARFESINEAQRKTGIWASNIQKCCRGKAKTTGGYRWMYLKEYEILKSTN